MTDCDTPQPHIVVLTRVFDASIQEYDSWWKFRKLWNPGDEYGDGGSVVRILTEGLFQSFIVSSKEVTYSSTEQWFA